MSTVLVRRDSSKRLQNLLQLTTQWSVEDEEEAARERRRRERERQGQFQDDESLTSPSVENGLSDVLDNRCDYSKPLGSSELEEDEGFSDWSLKLEQRKKRSVAQEAERLSAMSGPEAADGSQEQQGFGFKAFGGGFASLRINADCEFAPSEESAAQQDGSPEEGIEDYGQEVMQASLPSGLLNLEEDEALRGMGSLNQEEERRDLERTIQRDAELEELKREARRRQQEEEEARRCEEEKYQQEEELRQQVEEYSRREEEERRREEEMRWRMQEEHRREQKERRALEEAEARKAEEEERERQRWEASEQRSKTLSISGSDGDECHRPLSPMSPTVKILERTESLNRSIQKSNSIKKTQPPLPISKIDDRLEQYTHAIEKNSLFAETGTSSSFSVKDTIENPLPTYATNPNVPNPKSSSKTPKLVRQPSIELISTVEAVSNKKSLFEAGDISAQSGAKVTPSKDTEGLTVGISDLINQFGKGTPSPNSKTSPAKSGGSGNKKYKFVLTGHGKYEKVFVDDEDH